MTFIKRSNIFYDITLMSSTEAPEYLELQRLNSRL